MSNAITTKIEPNNEAWGQLLSGIKPDSKADGSFEINFKWYFENTPTRTVERTFVLTFKDGQFVNFTDESGESKLNENLGNAADKKYSNIVYEEKGVFVTCERILDAKKGGVAIFNVRNDSNETIDFKVTKHLFSGSILFEDGAEKADMLGLRRDIEYSLKPGDVFQVDFDLGLNSDDKTTGELYFIFSWKVPNRPMDVYSENIYVNIEDGRLAN